MAARQIFSVTIFRGSQARAINLSERIDMLHGLRTPNVDWLHQVAHFGQASLRAGQFVSSTGDPGLYQNALDYNIQTPNLNQQALAQKRAGVVAPKLVVVPKVA